MSWKNQKLTFIPYPPLVSCIPWFSIWNSQVQLTTKEKQLKAGTLYRLPHDRELGWLRWGGVDKIQPETFTSRLAATSKSAVYFSGTSDKNSVEKNGWKGLQIIWYSDSSTWWNSIAFSKHFMSSPLRTRLLIVCSSTQVWDFFFSLCLSNADQNGNLMAWVALAFVVAVFLLFCVLQAASSLSTLLICLFLRSREKRSHTIKNDWQLCLPQNVLSFSAWSPSGITKMRVRTDSDHFKAPQALALMLILIISRKPSNRNVKRDVSVHHK